MMSFQTISHTVHLKKRKVNQFDFDIVLHISNLNTSNQIFLSRNFLEKQHCVFGFIIFSSCTINLS